MEALSLIDVAAEDDLLLDLASPPPLPSPHPHPPHAGLGAEASDLEPAGDSPAAGRVLDRDGEAEQVPERSESPKQWKAKAGVNLRKSLAWDSAFFTSEGVLDTEELAIVNSTFRKAQDSRLPGIAEDMMRSGESTTSTLASESWVLESLETNLFDSVRASIQRTLGKPDKAPGVTAATSKTSKATTNVPRVAARKGIDRMPQSKIRPPVSTSHGGVSGKERPQVNSKEPTTSRVAMQGAAEGKPSSRLPRALPRVATMRAPTNTPATCGFSDKRSSTGGVVNRQAVGKSANTSASKHSRPCGVTKSSSTPKSGAFSSAAASPSHSVSMGTMPGVKTRCPSLSNKNRTAQRIPIRSSSRSDISKVNPAIASRNKIPARSHGDRTSLSISPSSSVDSMSSVVSGVSTASTAGKMSHTSESFSTWSSSLSPSLRKSNDCPTTTKLGSTIVTERQSSGTASGDNLKASADTTTQGKGFKPSGLRMPTPKIGYFDAEKSIEQNIGAQVQVQPAKIQCLLPVTPKPQVSSTQMVNLASKPMAAPHEESSASQTKASPSLLLRVAQMEVEPSKATEHEASMHQIGPVVTEDTAKENIPALHQNIQANGDASPLTVELLTQKLSSISLGETPDLVS